MSPKRSSTTAPKGFNGVRGGRGNSESRLIMLSGPMKIRWNFARTNKWDSWIQTSRGKDDSARAPRMKIRSGGGEGRRSETFGPRPRRGGWRL